MTIGASETSFFTFAVAMYQRCTYKQLTNSQMERSVSQIHGTNRFVFSGSSFQLGFAVYCEDLLKRTLQATRESVAIHVVCTRVKQSKPLLDPGRAQSFCLAAHSGMALVSALWNHVLLVFVCEDHCYGCESLVHSSEKMFQII
jgi:hypothetical protein